MKKFIIALVGFIVIQPALGQQISPDDLRNDFLDGVFVGCESEMNSLLGSQNDMTIKVYCSCVVKVSDETMTDQDLITMHETGQFDRELLRETVHEVRQQCVQYIRK